MTKDNLLILSPKFIIKNTPEKKELIYYLLNLAIIISSPKQIINFKLISGDEQKFIIELEETINIELFKEIIENGNLNLFSRGNIKIQTNSFEYCFFIEDFLNRLDDNKNNLLDYTANGNLDKKNYIEVDKILNIDINFWKHIDNYKINLNTLVGYNKSNIQVNFIHTGSPNLIESRSRKNIWSSDQEDKNSIFYFKEKNFKEVENNISIFFLVSFNKETEDHIIINDSKSQYENQYFNNFKTHINKIIKSNLKPRLINQFKFFLEINTSDSEFSNYNGYLSTKNISFIEKSLKTYLWQCNTNKDYELFLDRVQESFIDKEDKILVKRKTLAETKKDVYFKNLSKKNFLIKVPENEQEVVILTSILASKKLFFLEFAFLDYMTAKGIDSIANFKIAEGWKTHRNAVVEFKLKLESFTDERHPINLVDLVIAWSVNKKSFISKPFKIKNTKIKGVYKIEHKNSSQETTGLVLNEIDGMVIE